MVRKNLQLQEAIFIFHNSSVYDICSSKTAQLALNFTVISFKKKKQNHVFYVQTENKAHRNIWGLKAASSSQ